MDGKERGRAQFLIFHFIQSRRPSGDAERSPTTSEASDPLKGKVKDT